MSYNVNCVISYKKHDRWGFSVEPGLIQKGALGGVQLRSKIELKYFQMPTLANIYFLHKFFISIGPEFSFLIDSRYINPKSTIDASSVYKKFELSGLIGINYMITKSFDFGLRYSRGLTYIMKMPLYGNSIYGNYWEVVGIAKQYNECLQLTVSVTI